MAVEGDPARDDLVGQQLDLLADPVVDRLEDARPAAAARRRRPGPAGCTVGRAPGSPRPAATSRPGRAGAPRSRCGPGREQQLEVEQADLDRLGVDPGVLVLEHLGVEHVPHRRRPSRLGRDVGPARADARHGQVHRQLLPAFEGRLQVERGQDAVLGDRDQRAVAEPRLQRADDEPGVRQGVEVDSIDAQAPVVVQVEPLAPIRRGGASAAAPS